MTGDAPASAVPSDLVGPRAPAEPLMQRLLRAVWGAALLTALVVGGCALRPQLATMTRVPFGATTSTDALLAGIVAGAPARRLGAELASLPSGDAVLFVGSEEDHRYAAVLYTVSLLALPRQVGALRCRADGSGYPYVPTDADRSVGAVLYFARPVPRGAESLGPLLALMRVHAVPSGEPWTPFCSPPP